MNQPNKERFKTSVGGQALMEGIMMRGPKNICCAVTKPDGTIETKVEPTPTHGVWTKIPLVRGAISMIESLIMGYKYMMQSAQVSMGDDYDHDEETTVLSKVGSGDHSYGTKTERTNTRRRGGDASPSDGRAGRSFTVLPYLTFLPLPFRSVRSGRSVPYRTVR